MGTYANFHSILDTRRRIAEQSGGAGPRVLIAGPVVSRI